MLDIRDGPFISSFPITVPEHGEDPDSKRLPRNQWCCGQISSLMAGGTGFVGVSPCRTDSIMTAITGD